jgi:hypothetical protein
MSVFETAILPKVSPVYRGFTPDLADRVFWSAILISPL